MNQEIKKVALKYQIREIYIFGSEVTGTKHPESDLDVGIIFKNGLPELKERMRIYGEVFFYISNIFPNKKIDLVFLEETPLHFQFKVLTEGQPLYLTELEESFNYKERIINLYRDWKYFIDEFYRGVLESTV